ncbi:hypothetical protein FB451DRAFT_1553712 [Mycena latifolia]|nr:hypothetical protein FB451DRAFT_1553712 [Mycena latifolia]
MVDATETVFGLQELCDHIAYHLSLQKSSRHTLESTALVCQTFRVSAQSQLFRHVDLDPWAAGGLYKHSSDSALATALTYSHRLSAILTASPHLLRHIRSLSVLGRSEILQLVLGIGFPLLQKISFNFKDLEGPNDDVFQLTRECIGLPLIREVEIFNLFKREREQPSDLLTSLFESRTRDLDSLAFSLVQLTSVPSAGCPPYPREMRAQIRKLRLIHSDELIGWFISPSCPFDFTQLVEVETDATADSTLLPVLASARSSIRRLQITRNGDLASELRLSQFSALTFLEIPLSLQTHEVMSSLTPDNRLERLVLYVGAYIFQDDDRCDDIRAIDAFVASLPMPALRQVELLVGGPFQVETAISCFPQLEARGLLVVTNYRYYDPSKLRRLLDQIE